jgi:murein L,D-transpeptidase YcbB/YkuD
MMRIATGFLAALCFAGMAAAAAPPPDPLQQLHTQPLWFQGPRLGTAGRALLEEMRAAEARGLDPADYGAEELHRNVAALESAAQDAGLAARRLVVERSLSAAALRFLRHLERGRIEPDRAGYHMPLPTTQIDWPAALRELAASRDVAGLLDRYEPEFVHFALLKQALGRYRDLGRQTGLTPLPSLESRTLEQGARWRGVPALRRLLAAVGDQPPPAAADDDLFDAPLVAALARFQARHGLDADGVLGRDTLAALNVPLTHRVDQLLWSMERARWLPEPGGKPFILVNIPQYRLFAFAGPEDREAVMTPMNVIVGQAFPQLNTPIFTADMRYVVIRPYWDVPRSIAVKELLAPLRGDHNYAARHRYELVRGQSDSSPVVPVSDAALDELERGALRIRQRPGRDNALGLIKFMFPNPYNVYLHSTPAQSLFTRTRRAFSHGCVRVEDPLALASFVFGAGSEWTPQRLAGEMAREGAGPLRIELREPLRVMMIYATALAAEDGRVLFFDDVYGHDRRLSALLARRAKGG